MGHNKRRSSQTRFMLLPGIHWEWLRFCFAWSLFIFVVSYFIKKIFFDGEAV